MKAQMITDNADIRVSDNQGEGYQDNQDIRENPIS